MAHGSKSKARTEKASDSMRGKIGSKMGGEFTYPKMVPLVLAHSYMFLSENTSRSPSSALSHPFLGEGSPTKIDYRKKKGTLILPSLSTKA